MKKLLSFVLLVSLSLTSIDVQASSAVTKGIINKEESKEDKSELKSGNTKNILYSASKDDKIVEDKNETEVKSRVSGIVSSIVEIKENIVDNSWKSISQNDSNTVSDEEDSETVSSDSEDSAKHGTIVVDDIDETIEDTKLGVSVEKGTLLSKVDGVKIYDEPSRDGIVVGFLNKHASGLKLKKKGKWVKIKSGRVKGWIKLTNNILKTKDIEKYVINHYDDFDIDVMIQEKKGLYNTLKDAKKDKLKYEARFIFTNKNTKVYKTPSLSSIRQDKYKYQNYIRVLDSAKVYKNDDKDSKVLGKVNEDDEFKLYDEEMKYKFYDDEEDVEDVDNEVEDIDNETESIEGESEDTDEEDNDNEDINDSDDSVDTDTEETDKDSDDNSSSIESEDSNGKNSESSDENSDNKEKYTKESDTEEEVDKLPEITWVSINYNGKRGYIDASKCEEFERQFDVSNIAKVKYKVNTLYEFSTVPNSNFISVELNDNEYYLHRNDIDKVYLVSSESKATNIIGSGNIFKLSKIVGDYLKVKVKNPSSGTKLDMFISSINSKLIAEFKNAKVNKIRVTEDENTEDENSLVEHNYDNQVNNGNPYYNQSQYPERYNYDFGNNSTRERNEIINYALQFLGNRYVYGGTDINNGIDCSAYVQYILRSFGKTISRTTYSQCSESVGKEITYDEIQPGDLIYYSRNGYSPYHVVMYLGGNKCVNASSAAYGICRSRYCSFR